MSEPTSQTSDSSSSALEDDAGSLRNRRNVVMDDTAETSYSTGTSIDTSHATPQHQKSGTTATVENEEVKEQEKQGTTRDSEVQGNEPSESSASSSSRVADSRVLEGQRTTHQTGDAHRRTTGEDRNGEYDCNICFEMASDPVLTLCGHLYCWPCLHQWIERNRNNPLCPVCKAGTGQDKVIPIYGRGKDVKDPRLKPQNVPNRPAGQRPEPNAGLDQNGDRAGGFFTPHMGAFFHAQGRVNVNRFAGRFVFSPWPNFEMEFGTMEPNEQTARQQFLATFFLMLGSLILLGIFLY